MISRLLFPLMQAKILHKKDVIWETKSLSWSNLTPIDILEYSSVHYHVIICSLWNYFLVIRWQIQLVFRVQWKESKCQQNAEQCFSYFTWTLIDKSSQNVAFFHTFFIFFLGLKHCWTKMSTLKSLRPSFNKNFCTLLSLGMAFSSWWNLEFFYSHKKF